LLANQRLAIAISIDLQYGRARHSTSFVETFTFVCFLP
jgi:hypothetical protein